MLAQTISQTTNMNTLPGLGGVGNSLTHGRIAQKSQVQPHASSVASLRRLGIANVYNDAQLLVVSKQRSRRTSGLVFALAVLFVVFACFVLITLRLFVYLLYVYFTTTTITTTSEG